MFQTNSHPLLRGKCIDDHLVNLRRKQRRHFPLSSLPSHWSWKQSELLTHEGGSVRSVRSTYDTTRCLFVQSNCLFYRIGSPRKSYFWQGRNRGLFSATDAGPWQGTRTDISVVVCGSHCTCTPRWTRFLRRRVQLEAFALLCALHIPDLACHYLECAKASV